MNDTKINNSNNHSTVEISSTIPNNKSVFNTEAQKELMEHSFKLTFKYMLYTFLIIVPFILLMIFGLTYVLSR